MRQALLAPACLLALAPAALAGPGPLAAGQPAPAFATVDVAGKKQALEAYRGKRVLLCFFRYAACVFCNLRNHDMLERFPAWQQRGLVVLAFFESPAESVKAYVGQQGLPWPLIADPERAIYAKYGVTAKDPSPGMHAAGRLGEVWRGRQLGLLNNKPEGEQALLPAEFMVEPDGKVHEAYYATDLGDHVPFARIDAFVGL